MEIQNTKQHMMQLINGYIVSQALRVAAELEVADKLLEGPKTAEQLVDTSGCIPSRLYRVLRFLVSVGVFEQKGDTFEQNALSEHLRKESTETVWPAAVFSSNELFRALHAMPEALKDTSVGFHTTYGVPFFEFLQKNPNRGDIFDHMMQSFHGHEAAAVIAAYDFSTSTTLVDIGGGDGEMLTKILLANLSLQGILFDLPEVVGRSKQLLADHPAASRCNLVGGDFFDSIPANGDLYTLRHIIHDWADQPAIDILKTCRAAISPKGRLLIIEGVIEPGNQPTPQKLLDLIMMVTFSGQERTGEEYRILLETAGFEISRIIPTDSDVSVIEAVPV